MIQDCGNAIGKLLTNFRVKNLIVRGQYRFQPALAADRPIVQTLFKYRGCVENVMEVGLWPKRAQGAIARGMVLVQPGHAQVQALQVQVQARVCPGSLNLKLVSLQPGYQVMAETRICPVCLTPKLVNLQPSNQATRQATSQRARRIWNAP